MSLRLLLAVTLAVPPSSRCHACVPRCWQSLQSHHGPCFPTRQPAVGRNLKPRRKLTPSRELPHFSSFLHHGGVKVKDSLSPAQDWSRIPHLSGYNSVKILISWRSTAARAAPSRQQPGSILGRRRRANTSKAACSLPGTRSSREGWRRTPCRHTAARKTRKSGLAPTPKAPQGPP